MNQKLFSEFKKSTDQEVWDQIHKDLEGMTDKSILSWKSLDGITTQPFYDRDISKKKKLLNSFPEQWKTSHTITVKEDIKLAFKSCLAAKNQDIDVILLRLSSSVSSITEIVDIFAEINLTFYVIFEFKPPIEILEKLDLRNWIFLFDPITKIAEKGNWIKDEDSDLLAWSRLIHSQKVTSSFYVDNRICQNAGATIPQQLSYALSQAVDYLSRINSSKSEVEVIFHLAVGSNYFFEIAKIQSLKNVFSELISAYDFKITHKIIAEPSERNITLQDYNVNMLRSTTAMMAGILGGADILNNLPYDNVFNNPNKFGDRIAQNQLLILKNESFFDQVTNPAAGSYYIEQLTHELNELTISSFKEIENKSGFLNLLMKGKIQYNISKSAQKEQDLFDTGALVLVGTNRYQDFEASKTKGTRIVKNLDVKTLIDPIKKIRLSEKIEQEYEK
tara:strand:- start:839 stop:2179 length:1341 start_codon:yes stop_codon:yes gene_type:complete